MSFYSLITHHSSLIPYHLSLINYHFSWAIVVIGLCLVLLLIVAGISRHKKSATVELQLIGSSALVESTLSPEGTILIGGEIWRARSVDGSSIPSQTTVHIVESRGHLLLVDRDI